MSVGMIWKEVTKKLRDPSDRDAQQIYYSIDQSTHPRWVVLIGWSMWFAFWAALWWLCA